MDAIGWGLMSMGLMFVWCGWTCRNPALAVKDALMDTPPEKRQQGCQAAGSAAPIDPIDSGVVSSNPYAAYVTNPNAPASDSAVLAAQVAQQAGFRGTSLIVAVAVAGAESGWNTTSTGDTGITDATWGASIGLWQIRSLKAQAGTGGWRDASRLLDPVFNAKAAYAISLGGTSWAPWSTYTNGRYRQYLNAAKDAVSRVGG